MRRQQEEQIKQENSLANWSKLIVKGNIQETKSVEQQNNIRRGSALSTNSIEEE